MVNRISPSGSLFEDYVAFEWKKLRERKEQEEANERLFQAWLEREGGGEGVRDKENAENGRPTTTLNSSTSTSNKSTTNTNSNQSMIRRGVKTQRSRSILDFLQAKKGQEREQEQQGSMWVCLVCTLLNEPSSLRCQACQSSPSSSSSSSQS